MACRSCGLGPKRIYKSNKTVTEPAANKTHPAKGTVKATQNKPSVPTRSPARTFKTLGD